MANRLETYVTRITWNEDNWRRPSGAGPKSETGTYVAKYGFGHEEWLNRREWVFDGWRYGFLQGVSRSRASRLGDRVHIRLYTITARKERLYVGEIHEAEVIDDDSAALALEHLRRGGQLAAMAREIEAVGGDSSPIRKAEPSDVANIMFRPRSLVMYATPVTAKPQDLLHRYNRYTLNRANKRLTKEWAERTRRAPLQGRGPSSHQRVIVANEIVVDAIEARMQDELWAILQAQFPSGTVERERDHVDLTVVTRKSRILIELKKSTSARQAIQKGLGQLLDYAFFEEGTGNPPRLVIVGQGPDTPAVARYIRHLSRAFGIPLRYLQYVVGSKSFRL